MPGIEEDKIRIRLAEIMSGAGLGYNQISLEILYMLPREFVDRYIQLWEKAYGPPVRGGGDQMARDGELGRAETSTRLKGKVVGSGAGGASKRFSRVMQMKDERAFRLKERIDKRLRSIGRDMREELLMMEGSGSDRQSSRGGSKGRGSKEIITSEGISVTQCGKCGRIMGEGWRFCPNDGSQINRDA